MRGASLDQGYAAPVLKAAICALAAVGGPATASAASAPGYTFSSHRVSAALRTRMTGSSWHQGCPVALADLRYLRIGYWGFDRRSHVGKMVVAASAVDPVRQAFGTLFAARFPIRRMHLVDDYGASDYDSIDADNTSAFNCRPVTGGTAFSEHAYGRAIDINPIENPYVYPDGTTVHKASEPYLDRSHIRRGMAFRGGVLVNAFASVDWGWGGSWKPPSAVDLQHFSSTCR
jgi:D-alanyl-D-alanine carboxypeptidase